MLPAVRGDRADLRPPASPTLLLRVGARPTSRTSRITGEASLFGHTAPRITIFHLTLVEYAKVEAMADILADEAETLGEPYSRHLVGKTRELRFRLDRSAVRISYWLAPGARVVLLTVFRKTRRIERAEVARAVTAQRLCESGHEAHTRADETYERVWR
jgi:hypothetical protein